MPVPPRTDPRKLILGIALGTLGVVSPIAAQLINPLPSLAASGLAVEIEEWLTIPASGAGYPLARINHLKPCPDKLRLFCNDLRGKFWSISNGQATEFLDLRDHFPAFIDSPGLGTGFGSFAFHPEFAAAGAPGYGVFFTSHVEGAAGAPPPDFAGPLSPAILQHGVVTQWSLANHQDHALTEAPANFSKRELMRIEFPSQIHGLQELAVDPNASPGDPNYGCLFICIGDGGSVWVGTPGNTGRLDSILGTIVRILPVLSAGQSAGDYTVSANGSYLIPNANPFFSAGDPTPGDGFGVVREIFAYGFRNPHRVCWDSAGTGKMICGMIGESNIEEIEVVESGRHYGWPDREGSYRFDPTNTGFVYPLPIPDSSPPHHPSPPSAYTYPAAQFDHQDGIAIAGGFVYRGSGIPELYGMYLCGGIAWGRVYVVPEADLVLQQPPASGAAPATLQILGLQFNGTPTTFNAVLGRPRADLRLGADHEGELYLLSKQNGKIYRVNSVGHIFVPGVTLSRQADHVQLHFPTTSGPTYRYWSSRDLRSWTISTDSIPGTGSEEMLTHSNPAERGFFLVEERAP